MKNKILAVTGLASAFLLSGGSAFAQTVTPIAMDTGVQAQVLNLISSYITIAFSLLGVVIGVVGVLWITMKGIGLIFKYFHMFGH